MMDGADRDDLVGLLQRLVVRRVADDPGPRGQRDPARIGGDPEAPPDDTGEALDLPASGLTITFGFGPGLFERDGVDRFGLAAQRPPELERLPPFVGDALKAAVEPRRPVRPGLRRRSAGRRPRGPQPVADRLRPGGHPLVADGLRADVEDDHRPSRRRATSWASRTARTTSWPRTSAALDQHVWVPADEHAGLARRRQLPRRPQDRDAHRVVGPRPARRAGGDHRPERRARARR